MRFAETNLLFIHIPKNAGTAVEETIVNHYKCDRHSIVKTIDAFSKSSVCWDLLHLTQLFSNNIIKLCVDEYHKKLVNHDCIDKSCIIFTVVRHPQKRMESLFKYTCAYKYKTFREFIYQFIKTDMMPPMTSTQLSFICKANGRRDKRVHILRHENLDEDWKLFCDKYHLECGPLMKENVSCSSDKVAIEWTDELRNIVYKLYKCDFKTFGYEIY